MVFSQAITFVKSIGNSGMIQKNSVFISKLCFAIPIAIEIIRLGKLAVYSFTSEEKQLMNTITWKQIKIKSSSFITKVRNIDKKRLAKYILIAGVISIAGIYLLKSQIAIQMGQTIYTFLKNTSFVQLLIEKKRLFEKDIWNPPFVPKSTKFNVYAGYSLSGLAHIFQAWRAHSKKSKLKAIMHTSLAIIACATPIMMEMGLTQMRWHHSMYGLLSAIPGTSALALFGTAISLDSVGYWIQKNPKNYGMDNIFVESMGAFIIMLTVTTTCEILSNCIKKYKKKKNLEKTFQTV